LVSVGQRAERSNNLPVGDDGAAVADGCDVYRGRIAIDEEQLASSPAHSGPVWLVGPHACAARKRATNQRRPRPRLLAMARFAEVKATFWSNGTYGVQSPLTDELGIREAELELGVRLPSHLLDLLRIQNGGDVADEWNAFPTTQPTSWSADHVPFDELMGIGHHEDLVSLLDTPYLVGEWDRPSPVVLLSGDGAGIAVTAGYARPRWRRQRVEAPAGNGQRPGGDPIPAQFPIDQLIRLDWIRPSDDNPVLR
jgi:hypothetical protein